VESGGLSRWGRIEAGIVTFGGGEDGEQRWAGGNGGRWGLRTQGKRVWRRMTGRGRGVISVLEIPKREDEKGLLTSRGYKGAGRFLDGYNCKITA